VLFLEVFSDQWLHRALMSYVPVLRPRAEHLDVQDGRVSVLMPYLLNRGMVLVVLLFWPAVLMAAAAGFLRNPVVRAVVLVLAGVTIFASESGTAGMALAGSAAVFGLMHLDARLTRRALVACWAALCLLVVPAVMLAYGLELYRAPWLPDSVQHRIVIWGHTARQVARAPLLGAGIGTARTIDRRGRAEAPLAPGSRFALSTSLHSHNAYLQVWYETGAAGALILLSLGLAVLRALARAPPGVQPHLHAVFAAGALTAASGFSLWAPWFMAALAIAALYGALGAALAAVPDRAQAVPPPRATG
jgi:O-antigen ligase